MGDIIQGLRAGRQAGQCGATLDAEEVDEILAIADEIERLRSLIGNPHYLDRKARYLKGQLAFANEIAEMESR